MRWPVLQTIYRKEILDLVRDRRTLISMIVVPLAGIPLLTMVATRLIEKVSTDARDEAKKAKIAVQVTSPDLKQLLQNAGLPVVARTDFKVAIESKEIAAAVEEKQGTDGRPVILLYVDRSNPTSSAAGEQLRTLLDEHREAKVRRNMQARGVPPEELTPFTIKRENVAGEKKMAGAAWGSMLGYILLLLMFSTGMYPVIDMTAGEKERKTIEMFLSAPVHRGEIVLGKIAAAVTAIFVAAMLTLGSLVLSLKNGGGSPEFRKMMGTIPLDATSIGLIVVTLIPLSVFAAATMIAIALFARSFKEGQSYLTPLMMVVIFPALMGGLPGLQLSPAMALVPIFNVSQLLRGILTGDYSFTQLAITTVANLVYAGIAYGIAKRTFENESVLFRS